MKRILSLVGFLALLAVADGTPRTGEPDASGAGSWVRAARAEEGRGAEAVEEAGSSVVETERRVARSRFRYLAVGYGLIWIALGVYLFRLNGRVAAVGREITELRRRLENSKGTGSG